MGRCVMDFEKLLRLAARIRRHPKTLLSVFDDAGAWELDGEYILLKIDGFAASRALYPWCTLYDLGFRGVVAAVSDVYAKGCRPLAYAVSLGLKTTSIDLIEEFIRGVEDAVSLYGGYIENIDTNVGDDSWIDVAVIAVCRYRPVPRVGVKPGHMLALIGRRIGLQRLAYEKYLRGVCVPRCVEEASCRPSTEPRVVDLIELCRHCISASIDISDTVAEALETIATLNNVGIYLSRTGISYALDPLAKEAANSLGISEKKLFLETFEEYVPMIAVYPWCKDFVEDMARWLGIDIVWLGVATSLRSICVEGEEIPSVRWSPTSDVLQQSS